MSRGQRRVAASSSASASRRSSARKASPASARLGRRIESGHRHQRETGGNPSGRWTGGPIARTRQQLYQEAKARDIKGRASMTRAELARALGE